MTTPQKITLGILLTLMLAVLCALLGVLAWFLATPVTIPAANAVAQQKPPAQPTRTSTRPPQPTSTAVPPPAPTSTATRVVVTTVQPTPTPTRANCTGKIRNFGDSGALTDAQVQQYLQQTLPATHLDNCRGIEYVHTLAKSHGDDIAGNIIPGYRIIFVYALGLQEQNADDLLDTLVHEIGHNVHMNIRQNNFDLDVTWAKLFADSQITYTANGLGFVSDYARTNKFEDFAESYRAYVRNPGALQQANLEKYQFMQQYVFNNREYPR